MGSTAAIHPRKCRNPDHPHAGGEHRRKFAHNWRGGGPSPRGWGARRRRRIGGHRSRTIPTRVGSTPPVWRASRLLADHPHAGGEHMRSTSALISENGPSPRGWGAPPAQAVSRRKVSDHPHAGGEHGIPEALRPPLCGPSPRGWGAHAPPFTRLDSRRTIPTRVGSTGVGGEAQSAQADHPHAGGEHSSPVRKSSWPFGPSPRGWGAPKLAWRWLPCKRTIPTRVGSTLTLLAPPSPTPDHPHAGGEHSQANGGNLTSRGPSPRGWGARAYAVPWPVQQRTIPTRVGSTAKSTAFARAASDHPHAGGEHCA